MSACFWRRSDLCRAAFACQEAWVGGCIPRGEQGYGMVLDWVRGLNQ